MRKIIIKNRWTDAVLFEHECKDNTIKKTLEEGVKTGANLHWANLPGANLPGAMLIGAKLTGANLPGANLPGANLTGANLRWANLPGANLTGAMLIGAKLTEAKLPGANLTGAKLTGANLTGSRFTDTNLDLAILDVKNPPLMDRTFISEILRRKANTEQEKDFASRILGKECWLFYYQLAKEKRVLKWAEEILSHWKEYEDKIEGLKIKILKKEGMEIKY